MDRAEINLTNSNNNVVNQTIKYSGILDNLTCNLNLLENIIDIIYKNIDDIDLVSIPEYEKLKRNIKKKNKINSLSTDTYNNIIKENIEEYNKIKEFLSHSENRNLKRKYLAIKKNLFPGIISALDQGKTMDEILNSLNNPKKSS